MFSNFTEKSREALRLAHDAACLMGHRYVGSEHLLMGLINEGSGVAWKTLSDVGITAEMVEKKISEIIGKEEALSTETELSLTPRSKRILELAAMEARRLGHNYIGTEHILMAIAHDSGGVAAQILAGMGVNLGDFYVKTLNSLDNENLSPKSVKQKSSNATDKKTPTLNKFGRDLTDLARDGKFDPVIGRDKEIERIIQILSRRTKNNPCLIGEPGVGKTAVVEGLAQRISAGDVPEILKNKRLVTVDLSSMVAGAKYRGEFEERLKKVVEEVMVSGDVILFIDEIHTIVGAGSV